MNSKQTIRNCHGKTPHILKYFYLPIDQFFKYFPTTENSRYVNFINVTLILTLSKKLSTTKYSHITKFMNFEYKIVVIAVILLPKKAQNSTLHDKHYKISIKF